MYSCSVLNKDRLRPVKKDNLDPEVVDCFGLSLCNYETLLLVQLLFVFKISVKDSMFPEFEKLTAKRPEP